MPSSEIRNAIIEDATLSYGDRGILECWLTLDYGGSGQGFGGYTLYLPKSYIHHKRLSHAGHFLYRCMEVAGVTDWSKLKGRTVRVRIDGGLARAIGHIVKDDWFCPEVDFKEEAKP